MRLNHALVALLVSLTFAERISGPHGLHIRQDNNGNVATASDRLEAPSATDDNERSTVTQPDRQQSTVATRTPDSDLPKSTASNNEQANSSTNTTSTARPSATLEPSSIPTAANATTEPVLPIEPQITPALGVGGAILIIAGLALGFVGIKHRATQTFLSTALVTALGVVVLIIYLMNPPVSNAIEGAFLVGAVLGGCLLGGLALIFKEVSEGLGCILGGFCLAMWLLILAPGGTITNQVGRIILICMLCAGCFCLYISRFTRIYGIIICTSFAGATAFILGVDCFSKAGMKEFWLYLWNINDNIFPLSTDTYPITKNMRAETAGIVILAFFGTMSQIKIWKIVKETKAKRDAERTAYEEAREAEEAELGRDIEQQVKKDREAWEGNYGGKDMSKVQAYSTTARSIDGFDGGVSEIDLTADTKFGEKKRSSFLMANLSSNALPRELQRMSSGTSLGVYNTDRRASAAPSIPELDFGDRDDRRVSRLTIPSLEVPRSPSNVSLPVSQVSAPDPAKRTSKIVKLSTESLAAREALEVDDEPQSPIEEDLASSVAATAAEPPDADALSVAMSRPASMFIPYGLTVHNAEQVIEDEDEEALHLGVKNMQRGAGARRLSASPSASYYDSKVVAPDGETHTELKDKLPTRMSKAAMNYRTNEWAKGVSHAEPEPIEEVPDHTLDAVQIEIGNAVEAARAEENNAAPAPPPPPPAPPAAKRVSAAAPAPAVVGSRRESTNPYRQSKRISSNPVPSGVENEAGWPGPLEKRSSSNPLTRATPVYSAEGGAATQPIHATSPTKSARRASTRQSGAISPMPSMSNLLDERRERIDQRLTSTSFMVPTISEDPKAVSPESSRRGSEQVDKVSVSDATKPSTNTSIEEERQIHDDEEDMTLAQRKALVQQQQQQQQQQQMYQQQHQSQLYQQPYNQHQSQTFTTLQHRPSQTFTTLQHRPSEIFPTPLPTAHHPPRRASTHDSNKAAANWSQWRASTQQDAHLSTNNFSSSSHNLHVQHSEQQLEMLRQQRDQVEYEKEMRRREQAERQAEKDRVMRMGGLHDKHRAALARMQGTVDVK